MSSILKAMKKREHSVGPENVASAQGAATRRPHSHSYLWPVIAGLAVGLLAVVLFLGLWTHDGNNHEPKRVAEQNLVKSPLLVPPAVKEAVASGPATAPFSEPAVVVEVLSAKEPVAVKSPQKPPVQAKIKSQSPPKIQAVDASSAPVSQPVESNPPSDANALPPGYELLVTEIFYQEGQGNSMAIINDLPVMEGTPIDSAMVEKIYPDQVQFLILGKTYRVKVSPPQTQ